MTFFKATLGLVAVLAVAGCAPMTDTGEIIKDSDNSRPAEALALGDCVARCTSPRADKHSSVARKAQDTCVAACSGH